MELALASVEELQRITGKSLFDHLGVVTEHADTDNIDPEFPHGKIKSIKTLDRNYGKYVRFLVYTSMNKKKVPSCCFNKKASRVYGFLKSYVEFFSFFFL